jgi:hypothetical protein
MERNEGPSVHLPSAGDLLRAKVAQNTNRTIAATLSILEEMADEHDVALAKLKGALPPDYRAFVDLADWLSQARFDILRNRILKTANDGRRDVEETISGLRL